MRILFVRKENKNNLFNNSSPPSYVFRHLKRTEEHNRRNPALFTFGGKCTHECNRRTLQNGGRQLLGGEEMLNKVSYFCFLLCAQNYSRSFAKLKLSH